MFTIFFKKSKYSIVIILFFALAVFYLGSNYTFSVPFNTDENSFTIKEESYLKVRPTIFFYKNDFGIFNPRNNYIYFYDNSFSFFLKSKVYIKPDEDKYITSVNVIEDNIIVSQRKRINIEEIVSNLNVVNSGEFENYLTWYYWNENKMEKISTDNIDQKIRFVSNSLGDIVKSGDSFFIGKNDESENVFVSFDKNSMSFRESKRGVNINIFGEEIYKKSFVNNNNLKIDTPKISVELSTKMNCEEVITLIKNELICLKNTNNTFYELVKFNIKDGTNEIISDVVSISKDKNGITILHKKNNVNELVVKKYSN